MIERKNALLSAYLIASRNASLIASLNASSIASGIAFERLPDGNFVMEFQDDNGMPLNTQVIAADLRSRLPVVVEMAICAS